MKVTPLLLCGIFLFLMGAEVFPSNSETPNQTIVQELQLPSTQEDQSLKILTDDQPTKATSESQLDQPSQSSTENQSLIKNISPEIGISDYYPTKLPTINDFYVIFFLQIPLLIIICILTIYVVRHYVFAFNRFFGKQHNLYAEIIDANWPSVTILSCAHNEENVIGDLLSAVLEVDYPRDKLNVVIANDRSTDRTGEIVDAFVRKYPGRIVHFERKTGIAGKAAALNDAMSLVTGSILLIFDADYIPGRFLIKNLVTPFFDPEVGVVMGRVMPGNVEINLLTRLTDMERCGGYQVNQQARENMHLVPQYGGTAGGVRMEALEAVGGWNPNYLAEDTEMTFRLLSNGWLPVYQNNAECIELAAESWSVRVRQIKRWSKGHNQVLVKYLWKTMTNKNLPIPTRIDGVLLLFTFFISPVLFTGWVIFILNYFFNTAPGVSGVFGFILLISFIGLGNFTVFFEIAVGVHLDNLRGVKGDRIRLLPFTYLQFFVSMIAITMALIEQLTIDRFKKGIVWHRTEHLARKPPAKKDSNLR